MKQVVNKEEDHVLLNVTGQKKGAVGLEQGSLPPESTPEINMLSVQRDDSFSMITSVAVFVLMGGRVGGQDLAGSHDHESSQKLGLMIQLLESSSVPGSAAIGCET